MKIKKIIYVIFLIIILNLSCFKFTEKKIINENNEFNGKTILLKYNLSLAYEKEIIYFDNNNKKIKKEYYWSNWYQKKSGKIKNVTFFKTKLNGEIVELYYTNEYSKKEGLEKIIDYYNLENKRIKLEYFYTQDYLNENSYNKFILYYKNENIIKKEYYLNDFLIKTVNL